MMLPELKPTLSNSELIINAAKITEKVASTGSAAGKVALFLPLLAKVFQ